MSTVKSKLHIHKKAQMLAMALGAASFNAHTAVVDLPYSLSAEDVIDDTSISLDVAPSESVWSFDPLDPLTLNLQFQDDKKLVIYDKTEVPGEDDEYLTLSLDFAPGGEGALPQGEGSGAGIPDIKVDLYFMNGETELGSHVFQIDVNGYSDGQTITVSLDPVNITDSQLEADSISVVVTSLDSVISYSIDGVGLVIGAAKVEVLEHEEDEEDEEVEEDEENEEVEITEKAKKKSSSGSQGAIFSLGTLFALIGRRLQIRKRK